MSLAYITNVNLLETLEKSFMYSIKSRGPRIEPWRTPLDIVKVFKNVTLKLQYCFLSVK